ncbi:hypothetical protein F8S09_00255 [Deinococcus sp. SDU3-2]|uniref:GNAT family N-acetyltransferase n=1 Tax=Deinococcus terrestris TaxID=2651870 RepID=A0A7X1TQD5_9DEIO|nr:hypothetical protein [Deinococcus terrestris]MPY65127.1 hypothetical protein [Deinococcus terrestris]
MPTLTLRERSPADLPTLHRWLHAEPDPEWKRWDAPYFHAARPASPLSLAEFTERVGYRECGRVPEARAWHGQRWDSVRLAQLRRGWETGRHAPPHSPGPDL